MVVEPDWLVPGRIVTVRLVPLPAKVMFVPGASTGLTGTAERNKLLAADSASLIVNGAGALRKFSTVVTSAIVEITGGSLTAVMLMARLEGGLLLMPSLTMNCTVRVRVEGFSLALL